MSGYEQKFVKKRTDSIVSHRKSSPERLNPSLYCALSPINNRHLIVRPVSLNCLDYACKDCLPRTGYATLTCNNCGQKFRKSDLESMEESPLGKQLIKDNIENLFTLTLTQFDSIKDNFTENANMELRVNAQIENCKKEIRNRVDNLISQLDLLANELETEIESEKKGLKSTKNINMSKYQQFNEKAMTRYEQLKKDVQAKENQNEESFTAYQMTLKNMQETIDELKGLNPQLRFQPSIAKLDKNLIGKLNLYIRKNATRNKEINARIASGDFRVADINCQPWDACVLANGYLLIADLNQTSLFLYDANFKLARTITEISDAEFYPMGVATNGSNEIYIVNHCNEKIYKTDLDFNPIGECSSHGDDTDQLMHPRGIFYYQHSLFVCDCGSNRIQKFDSDSLIHQTTYNLDFSPSRIKISNNIACVIGGLNNTAIYFFDSRTFHLHHKYDRKTACYFIGVINSHFYEYNDRRIYFYDENGEFVQEFKAVNFGPILNEYNYDSGIVYFNSKVVLYNFKQKKLVII